MIFPENFKIKPNRNRKFLPRGAVARSGCLDLATTMASAAFGRLYPRG